MRPASDSEDCLSSLGSALPQRQETSSIGRPVDKYAKYPEQSLAVLHLVDDDQPVERIEREPGIGEAGEVGRVLQVEEGDAALFLSGQVAGQSRLADLPGTHEPDHGKLIKQAPEARFMAACLFAPDRSPTPTCTGRWRSGGVGVSTRRLPHFLNRSVLKAHGSHEPRTRRRRATSRGGWERGA